MEVLNLRITYPWCSFVQPYHCEICRRIISMPLPKVQGLCHPALHKDISKQLHNHCCKVIPWGLTPYVLIFALASFIFNSASVSTWIFLHFCYHSFLVSQIHLKVRCCSFNLPLPSSLQSLRSCFHWASSTFISVGYYPSERYHFHELIPEGMAAIHTWNEKVLCFPLPELFDTCSWLYVITLYFGVSLTSEALVGLASVHHLNPAFFCHPL